MRTVVLDVATGQPVQWLTPVALHPVFEVGVAMTIDPASGIAEPALVLLVDMQAPTRAMPYVPPEAFR